MKKYRLKPHVKTLLTNLLYISLIILFFQWASLFEDWLNSREYNFEPVYSIQIVEVPVVTLDTILYQEMELPTEATGEFKTYMDWRTLSNPASKQWHLQQLATTDDKGFRKYQGKYLIAVGSYYATSVGEEFRITLSSGQVFHAVVGDLKQDKHTDKNNQYIPENGNIVEFIVDTKTMSKEVKKLGNVSATGLLGSIIKIEKLIYSELQ